MKIVFSLIIGLYLVSFNTPVPEEYDDRRVYSINGRYNHSAKLFFVNGKIIQQYNHPYRDHLKRLFLGYEALDSSRLELESFFYKSGYLFGTSHHTNNTMHEMGYDYDRYLYKINLDNATLIRVATFQNMYLSPGDNFYYTKELYNDSILYKINPATGERTIFTTALPYVLDTGKYATGAHIFNFLEYEGLWQLSPTNYLMMFVDCSSDCSDYRYLLFNMEAKEYSVVKWYDSLRRQEAKYEEKRTGQSTSGYARIDFLIKTLDEDYFSYGFIDNGEEIIVHNEDYVFDENFNIVSKALKKTSYSEDVNYMEGKPVSVMVSTVLDNGKKVFTPYKFTLPLERSFYRIYHNQEILQEDLKVLDGYGLPILKNFIFAKHNYAFNADFYQAYFNLFEFYNNEEKRKSRTKFVNSKMTEIDKNNLALIIKALKKYD